MKNINTHNLTSITARVAVLTVALAAAVGSAFAAVITDDFNDGNDNGWYRVHPFGQVGISNNYQVVNGEYVMAAGPSPAPQILPATVAALPEAEDVDVDIRPEDIRIDTMRAGGAGGQHVNKTDSAVRITHLPTGLIVVSAEKSQHQNRRLAMQVLRSRLYEQERQRVADTRAAQRKGQVGSGDRSQRIRTYNFPQGRVTDHRIGLTLYSLPAVMEGNIEGIVAALQRAEFEEKLAALTGGPLPVRPRDGSDDD